MRSNSSLDRSGYSKTSKNERSSLSVDPKKNVQKSKALGSQRQFSKTSLTKNSSASSIALTNQSTMNITPSSQKKKETTHQENNNIEVYPESSRLLVELDNTTPNNSIFKYSIYPILLLINLKKGVK